MTAPLRTAAPANAIVPPRPQQQEIGGPAGPEPTRYGDWEYNGRCTDF
ncbi:MAG: succinate dehydrogenase assembly factor 4 [Stellaceae bacterium]